MRFADVNDDFEIAKTIVVNAVTRILTDFHAASDQISYFCYYDKCFLVAANEKRSVNQNVNIQNARFRWSLFFRCCRCRCYRCCRCFDFFFFFFSINASGIVVEYDKNENEENKSEIDMIYYSHRFFARLMLSMRATFEKWSIDDVRAFVEFASSKMRLMFSEQARMRV